MPWAEARCAGSVATASEGRPRDGVHARRRGAQHRAPEPDRRVRDGVLLGRRRPARSRTRRRSSGRSTSWASPPRTRSTSGDTPVDLEMTAAAGASFVAVGTTTPPDGLPRGRRGSGVERRRRLGGRPAGPAVHGRTAGRSRTAPGRRCPANRSDRHGPGRRLAGSIEAMTRASPASTRSPSA